MNGYKAFYRGRSIDVRADKSIDARDKAAVLFKARKAHEVTVVLCEKEGEQITHAASN